MSVLVIGSFMMDLVTKTKIVPTAGETVVGDSFQTFLGGKGANQAISAKRLGCEVTMCGMLGNDDFGAQFETLFRQEHMDLSYIKKTDCSTGIGSITLDDSGQNRIVIIPGANLEYKVDDLLEAEVLFAKANVVLTQLELQLSVIEKTAELAKKYNKIFILNPAPMQELSDEILCKVDYLTPNETELQALSGKELCNTLPEQIQACESLLAKGVKNVIVTLGDKGCLHVNDNIHQLYPTYKVKVIDTVAAGDAFNGALAHCLDKFMPIDEAIKYANAVGAISVQKRGAIPSLPSAEEVAEFLTRHQ